MPIIEFNFMLLSIDASEVSKRYILSFVVPGAYCEYSVTVGLNSLFKESMPSAKFQVIAGDKILAESVTFQPGDINQSIVAKLGDVRFLTLRMSYVHTPQPDELTSVSSHLAWVSHGVWGEPKLN